MSEPREDVEALRRQANGTSLSGRERAEAVNELAARLKQTKRERDDWRADAEEQARQAGELEAALRPFVAFQSGGYLAGQEFEETYALLVRDARRALDTEAKACP